MNHFVARYGRESIRTLGRLTEDNLPPSPSTYIPQAPYIGTWPSRTLPLVDNRCTTYFKVSRMVVLLLYTISGGVCALRLKYYEQKTGCGSSLEHKQRDRRCWCAFCMLLANQSLREPSTAID